MQKLSSRLDSWGYIIFSLTASVIIAADQLSKAWIRANLALGESIPIAGFFRISHVRNTGAAFGLFQDQSAVLAVVSFAGALFLLFMVFVMDHRVVFLSSLRGRVTLGLLLGGITGNLIDRLVLGYVTDFIDVGLWPAFNVADSSVVIGIIILSYSIMFTSPEAKSASEGQP